MSTTNDAVLKLLLEKVFECDILYRVN